MKIDHKGFAVRAKEMQSTAWQRHASLPKQMRRGLPACCVLLLFLLMLSGSFGGSRFLATKHPTFPRKVWQTWKVDPLGMEQKDSDVAKTWIAKNPSHRYEVLTDSNDLGYVEHNFGPEGFNRLDIVYVYRQLNDRILKADLLRYLVMYVEGGIYTDIDVEALKSADHFIPERFNEADIDMVVGVEIDEPAFIDHPILGQKCQSFCQWTFMCKPRLPVMLNLVESIMDWLRDLSIEKGVTISELELDFDQVISGTGPSAFTKAVLAEMTRKEGREVTWKSFHNLDESKLVGGVLVMTVEAFAAGQGHSDAGNHDTRHALVKHHYHASNWPSSHPRFSHPILGEVERCNWEPECVRKWDEDKAAFDALTPDEQTEQIQLKELEPKDMPPQPFAPFAPFAF
ncbi:hypothetical protein MBLNU230_g1254t1 [Neophaeotheca triangularis]